MQTEDPIKLRLRETTHEAVSKLIASGRFNQTEACYKIYNTAKQKNQATGFTLSDFKTFHNAYRKYKSKIISIFTKRNNG